MESKKTTSNLKKLLIVPILVFLVIIYILISIYYFAIKNTHESYSFTRSWKEYYSVIDWNLNQHAITDIDGDKVKDLISIDNCVYLSSLTNNDIPVDQQCSYKGYSSLVFPDKEKVGQRLGTKSASSNFGPHKSYLVKDNYNLWKYYDLIGYKVKVYKLQNKFFREISPSFLDYIDLLSYQLTHIGVSVVLISFKP